MRSQYYVAKAGITLLAFVILAFTRWTHSSSAEATTAPIVTWATSGDFIALTDDLNVYILDGNTLSPLNTLSSTVDGMEWASRVPPAWSLDGMNIALFNHWNVEIWNKPWSATDASLVSTVTLNGWPKSITWSPDGTVIAIAHLENIVIADASSGSIMRQIEGSWATVHEVIWDTDERLIFTGQRRFTAIINPITGDIYTSYYTTYEGIVSNVSVALSPDHQRIAIGDNEGFIEIRNDTQTYGEYLDHVDQRMKIPPYLVLHEGSPVETSPSVEDLEWSYDGAFVASASTDGAIRIWNPDTGKNIATITEAGIGFVSVAWHPNRLALTLGSADNTVTIITPALSESSYEQRRPEG